MAIYRNLADILVCWCRWRRRHCSCSGLFCGRVPLGWRLGLWRTRVVVQTCSGSSSAIDPSQLLNPSILPCHTAARALTSSSLSSSFCQRRSLSLSPLTAFLCLTSWSYISTSFSLTHTCSLSHASAQPYSSPSSFHRCADSAYPSSPHFQHFSSLSHRADFEALLPDLIKAPCRSSSPVRIQDVGRKTFTPHQPFPPS